MLGFPGDGAFRVTGELAGTEPCKLRVNPAEGTWSEEPRLVHDSFRETYVVAPRPRRYVAEVWCRERRVMFKEFEYRSGGDKIMVVDLGAA